MAAFTLHQSIHNQAIKTPKAIALLGMENQPIFYHQLDEQINRTVRALNQFGVGQQDCVGLALSNGPMLANSFLSIASGAVCAPLNPAYTEAEFDFYLSDLYVKALIVRCGDQSSAVTSARKLGIRVLEIEQLDGFSEGLFTFQGFEQSRSDEDPVLAQPQDVALMLHTSGTTSKPKIVPLTQRNLCSSAKNIINSLQLDSADRCLNVMPLFHIHGLVAAVLAPLIAGGSVVCSPGFFAPEFGYWLLRFQPTWYTAVPSMHQSILKFAAKEQEKIKEVNLRFIRSSSSPLAPGLMQLLEDTFQAPVLEAYGMTEASHQIACNPLPPLPRKAGSVGLPTGVEIAILDENMKIISSTNEMGEIIIRGKTVTLGYHHNPEANEDSFYDGWLRTGDQGFLDEDGYLFISGRIKEIINRGGEKISPREIDEVMLMHPCVLQAVTFAIPDELLGEKVATAVVLKEKSVGEKDLMKFVSLHLSQFKVPEKIVILDEIPLGPTGKVQRVGLAKKLGLDKALPKPISGEETLVSPRTDIEMTIREIWQQTLRTSNIGVTQSFRSLGGDSMLATLIHTKLETTFTIDIPLFELYAATTITAQAELIDRIMMKKK